MSSSAVTAANASRWAPVDLAGGTAANKAAGQSARSAADWEREVAEARAQGHAEGRAEGERMARAAEAAKLAGTLGALQDALSQVRESEESWLAALEDNIAALAVTVARQIVGRELRSDGSAMADLVRRALTEFPPDQPLRVRLHPQDLALLATITPIDGGPIPVAPGRNLRWMADPSVSPGGCLVEGRERIVDGRVDRALERVYRRLADD